MIYISLRIKTATVLLSDLKPTLKSFRKQRFMITKFLQGDFVSRHFLMQGFQLLLQIKEEMKTAVKNFAMRAVFALS